MIPAQAGTPPETGNVSEVFADSIEVKKLPIHTMKAYASRVAKIEPDQITSYAQEIKQEILLLATGKLPSFRFDIFTRNQNTKHFRPAVINPDGSIYRKIILSHELHQYSLDGGIPEEAQDALDSSLEEILQSVKSLYPSVEFVKLLLDVVFPVVVKWFLSREFQQDHEAMEYFMQNRLDFGLK